MPMNDLFAPLTDAELKEIRQRQAEIEPAVRAIHAYWLVARMPTASQSATCIRPEPKVVRNDRCPCGSGKRHKKCCGVR